MKHRDVFKETLIENEVLTVKDMIEVLEKLPKDMIVTVYEQPCDIYTNIKSINIEEVRKIDVKTHKPIYKKVIVLDTNWNYYEEDDRCQSIRDWERKKD